MGFAVIYIAGFVTFFGMFMRYYVNDHGNTMQADGLNDALLIAFLIGLLWPVVLICMFFMWLAPKVGI
jgi:hypothetical protein